jgi:glyoxylase-like metal-dependent hydrolase (beta-lactamase superfamily II)
MIAAGTAAPGRLATAFFSEHISIRFADGHTAAMMMPQIQYKGRTVVFMADLLPAAAHIPLPYVMAYDMFPLTTLQEKKDFLEEAVEQNYILFFEHDPQIECCTLEKTEKGIRMKEALQVKDL